MKTETVDIIAIGASFALVYLVFGLYVPDDVYLWVSGISAAMLAVAILHGEFS